MTDHERDHESTSVTEPEGTPPDDGGTYDPEMTEGDEANVPEGSEADPKD